MIFRTLRGAAAAFALAISAGAAAQTPAGDTDFGSIDGFWLVPAEAGWGLSVNRGRSSKIFAVWYAYRNYALDGFSDRGQQTPMWLVMPDGAWTSAMTFRGPLYMTDGIGANLPFDPARVHTTQVGTLSITFSSPTRATMEAEFTAPTLPPTASPTITVRRTAVLQKFEF